MTDLVKRAMFRVTQGNVSNLDTLDLVQLPLSLIDGNEGNFYAVEDIQDLKDSIALIGLQQPLVVLPVDGRYRLIAGHRRYKALSELGKETAPCVIQSGLTETEEQLALILTNSTTRELSYSEKMEQAKQLKELFVKRREEGAELPGRIRDIIADAMHESASNIARMEATDKHLIDGWKKELHENRLSASVAYDLSMQPVAVQQRLKEEYIIGSLLSSKIVKTAGKIMAAYPFAPIACPMDNGLSPCTRYTERAKMVADGTCPGCCDDCDHTERCSALCGLCKTQINRERERERQDREEQEAEEQYQKSAYRRAQLSLMKWAKDPRSDQLDALPYTVKFFRDVIEPRRNLWSPTMADLFELADMMQISVSDLLGLAPELPPCTSEWHKYPTDKPNEGETVLCQYSKHKKFDALTYHEEKFGKMAENEFIPLNVTVQYWTRAYPERD